jgi:hypothetical protein
MPKKRIQLSNKEHCNFSITYEIEKGKTFVLDSALSVGIRKNQFRAGLILLTA